MDHIVRYAILRAIPDTRRGERVNIGVVVFLPDRLDVRFAELSKLRALTGSNWEDYISSYNTSAQKIFAEGASEEQLLKNLTFIDGVISPTDLGWFSAASVESY